MKIDRRTALLGLMSTVLLKGQAQSAEPRSVFKLTIPDFTTFEFEYMGKTVSFSAAEIMSALKAVEVPANSSDKKDDSHFTPDGCFWSEFENKNICD